MNHQTIKRLIDSHANLLEAYKNLYTFSNQGEIDHDMIAEAEDTQTECGWAVAANDIWFPTHVYDVEETYQETPVSHGLYSTLELAIAACESNGEYFINKTPIDKIGGDLVYHCIDRDVSSTYDEHERYEREVIFDIRENW